MRLRPVVERALAWRGTDPLGAGLHRQALRADVEDRARSAVGRLMTVASTVAAQRSSVPMAWPLRGVHQRIRAGAKLCNAGQDVHMIHECRRRAVADRLARHAMLRGELRKMQRPPLRPFGQGAERIQVGRRIAVAVVRENAAERHMRQMRMVSSSARKSASSMTPERFSPTSISTSTGTETPSCAKTDSAAST